MKNHKCVFYTDQKIKTTSNDNKIKSSLLDYKLLSALFLDTQLDLLLHDILMHVSRSLTFEGVAISVLLTHDTRSLINAVRKCLGCKNFSNKACACHSFFF